MSDVNSKEYERLLRSAIDSYVAVLVVGTDDTILYANSPWRTMWGLPDGPPDVVDRKFLQLARNKIRDVDAFEARIAYLRAHPREESFELVQFYDGRIVERYTAPLYVDGELRAQVWAFRDLSDRLHPSLLSSSSTLVSPSGESARRLAATSSRVRSFVSEHATDMPDVSAVLISLLHDAIHAGRRVDGPPVPVLSRYRRLYTATGLGFDPDGITVSDSRKGEPGTIHESVDVLISAELAVEGLIAHDENRVSETVALHIRDASAEITVPARRRRADEQVRPHVDIARQCGDLVRQHAAWTKTIEGGRVILTRFSTAAVP